MVKDFRRVPATQIQEKNGIFFCIGEQQPFTGIVIESYEDGTKMAEAVILNGELLYFQKKWYNNGQLASEECYNESVTGYKKEWHSNGNLKMEGTIKNGKLIGANRLYHENGQLRGEMNFVDGETEGVCRTWDEYGQLRTEFTYRAGVQNGPAKNWDQNGVFLGEVIFKNGNLIGGGFPGQKSPISSGGCATVLFLAVIIGFKLC